MTLVFYRKRAFETEWMWQRCCGALSIKPLEGSRRLRSDGPPFGSWRGADAALVRVAEREGIRRIFTVDRNDFTVYRLHGRIGLAIVP